MREKRKGRKLISRIFAGLICAVLVATLLPGLPGGKANAASFPTTGTGISFKFTANGNTVDSSTTLNKGDFIYLDINIINDTKGETPGTTNGWTANVLTTGVEYVIPLSGSNVLFVGTSEPLRATLDGKTYEYGEMYVNADGDIAIKFKEDPLGEFHLEDVIDAHIVAKCTLDGDAVDKNSSNKIDIKLPDGTKVNVTVGNWVSKPATDPSISKKPENTDYKVANLGTTGTIKWTISYVAPTDGNAAAGYTGTEPKKILDTLPAGLVFDHADGTGITGSGQNITCTIADPKQNQDFVFYARLDGSVKTEDYWQQSDNKISFTNTAQLQDADGNPVKKMDTTVVQDATKPVKVEGPDKPGINKSGTIREAGGKQYIDWTVTVDPKKASTNGVFTSFKVKDTLGAALIRPADATVGSTTGVTVDGLGQNIEIDILSAANAGGTVTVQYTTEIKSGVGSTYQVTDLNNSASIDWSINATSGVATGSASKAVAPSNIGSFDFVPIKKSHGADAYDESKRQFTWDITIGNSSSSFTKIVFDDEPIAETGGNLTGVITHRFISSLNENKATPPTYTFKTDAEKKAEEEAFIKNQIINKLSSFGVNDSNTNVTITLGNKTTFSEGKLSSLGTADKLHIEITPTSPITGEFKFQVHSYSSYPIEYAGNNGGNTNHTNQAQLSLGTVNGGTSLTAAQIVTDNQTNKIHDSINKSVVSFDPASGVVTWKISLNGSNAPLENVLVEDTMPASGGISIASYVPGSATLQVGSIEDANPIISTRADLPKANEMYSWAKSRVYTNGEKIFFMIKDLNAADAITFQTKLNKNTYGPFKDSISIGFENKAKLINRDIYSSEGAWAPFVEQSGAGSKSVTIPNNVMSKTSDYSDSNTENKVRYSIALNPYGMTMNGGNKFTLIDTIDNSIVIDEDSVEIWKGVQAGTINGDNYTNADKITKAASKESIQPDFDHSGPKVKLKLELLDATPYIIEYEAYVVEAKNGLQNNVTLDGVTYPHKTDHSESKVTFNFASSSYATLSLPKKMQNQYLSISLKKVGSTGAALSGANFSLFKEATGGTAVTSGTTDDKGLLTFVVHKSVFTGSVIPSVVYLEETSDPAGHKRIPGRIEVETANLGTNDPDITLQNIAAADEYGKVIIKKKEAASSTMLVGAVFGIYTEEGCTNQVFKGTTNASGILEVPALKKDTDYWVKELVAPTGYNLNNTVKKVTATASGAEVTFENTKTSSTTPPPDSSTTPPDNGTTPPADGSTTPPAGGSTGGGSGFTSGGGGGSSAPLSVPSVTVPGPVLSTTQTDPAPTAPEAPGTPEAPALTPEGIPAVEGVPEASAAPAVTVTFQSDLGNIPAPQTMTPGQVAYNPGAPLDPASLQPGMVINGQRFEGWYTDPQFKNAYKFGTPVTEDMVLYAKWTKVGVAGKSPKTADNNWVLFILAGSVAVLLAGGIRLIKSRSKDN